LGTGNVIVRGEVRDSIVIFNGSAIIYGRVSGQIMTFNGDIRVESGGFSGSSLDTLNGEVFIAPGADALGPINESQFFEEMRAEWDRSAVPFLGVARIFSLFFGFVATLLLGLLLVQLLPKQMLAQAKALGREAGSILGVGFAALLLFIPMILLLMFSILGIPLIPVLILAYILAAFIGVIVVSLWLGQQLTGSRKSGEPKLLLSVTVGILIFSLIRIIPVFGDVITFILWIIGWGVVIVTRFGTRDFTPASPTQSMS